MNRISHTLAVIPRERASTPIAECRHGQYLLACDKNFHFPRRQIGAGQPERVSVR